MKISKQSVLAGMAVMVAMAISASPSEAAKRKAAKCDISRACSANCKSGSCEIRRCDPDGKTYLYLMPLTCGQAACPPKC